MLPAQDAAIAKLAGLMPAKAGKALVQFRVELDKLRETAGDLQGEVSSMYGVADRMEGKPQFGDGSVHGARTIGPRHDEVAALMQKLLTDIHGGIAAGEETLLVVAQRYAAADSRNEEAFRRAGREALDEQDFDDEDGMGDGERGDEPSREGDGSGQPAYPRPV